MFVSNVGGIIAAASKESAHPLRKTGKIPAIKRIVLSMQQAGLFPIVVVVGADDYESRYQLNNLNVVFLILEESEEKRELFHSVKAGLSYLQDKCLSVVFTPVNAPMFIPKTIVEMRKHHDDIVVPSYKKKAGHPVLISNEMIPDILAYDGENGLRGAIEKYAERRVFVEVDDIGVLSLNQEDDELQSQIEEHNKSILHPILTFGIGHETPFFNARLKLLLFLIEDLNNVRKACDTMALSPGKAWDMINELEDKLGYTVVKRRRGGRNGGKTFLTEDGRQFLITCQRFEEQVISFSEQKFEKMFLESHMLEKKEEGSWAVTVSIWAPSMRVTEAEIWMGVSVGAVTLASTPTGRWASTTAWAAERSSSSGARPSASTMVTSTVPGPLLRGNTLARRTWGTEQHHWM